MKDNEYKELKSFDEMTREEKKANKVDIPIEEIPNEAKPVNKLMYDVIGIIAYVFFAILFVGIGIIAMIQEDTESNTAILGFIFVVAGIFTAYKAIKFGKDLKMHLYDIKREKKAVITLHNIGYFIYGLVFITGITFFVLIFVNPESEFLTTKYNLFITIIIVEAITGTILMYADKAMTLLRRKNTKIIEINTDKNK